jgi:hypothetical protein
MDLPGADNGAPRVLKGPNGTTVNVTCGTAPYVCDGGTGYDTWASKFAGGCGLDSPSGSCNPNLYPYSEQSDDFSVANGAKAGTTAVKMFSPEQIPVKVCVCVRERVSVCESVCVRARAPVPVPMSQCLTVCLAVGLDCQRIRRLQ